MTDKGEPPIIANKSKHETYFFADTSLGYEFAIQLTTIGLRMVTRLRENSHLPRPKVGQIGFRLWHLKIPQGSPGNLERRANDQQGYKNANIVEELWEHGDVDKLCGIYEWGAIQSSGSDPTVVYVGSTCTLKSGPCTRMKNRIVSYCTHGNQKTVLTIDALQKGYELCVRFKPAADSRRPEIWKMRY